MNFRQCMFRITLAIQHQIWRVAEGDMSMAKAHWIKCLRWGTLIGVAACCLRTAAQEPANQTQPPFQESAHESVSDSIRELREQVRELQAAVAGMRSDWQQARTETVELRRELDEMRAEKGPQNAVLRNAALRPEAGSSAAAGSLPNVVQHATQDAASQDLNTESQKDE